MTHRILTLIFFQWLLITGFAYAEPTNSAPKNATLGTRPVQVKKSPEAYLMDGLACLKTADMSCAQLVLSSIPSQSPYAKLLSGNIAAAEGDFDRTFRLLLPLQADRSLIPQASASLHASLALAYENQSDTLRTLEQRVLEAADLSDPADMRTSQQRTWALLSKLPKDQLVEMRGEAQDTTIQGWIDLAIAVKAHDQTRHNLANWRTAYPDHPATVFSASLAETLASPSAHANSSATGSASLKGKIALLLPFANEAYYPEADAIERGFEAAQTVTGGSADIRIYPTTGNQEEINTAYNQAIADGANYVVGPLTRDEVTALAMSKAPVPTLALNQPDNTKHDKNFYAFGLNIEAEATQLVRLARDSGMQTAIIAGTMSATSLRMAKAFSDAWIADGGQIVLQTRITRDIDVDTFKSQITAHPADMALIAGNAEDARKIRPHIGIATPTFGFSRIFAGVRHESLDSVLTAVHFIDLPWLLNTEDATFSAYKPLAADLPPGEMQRWFAVGVDAYHILLAISQGQTTALHGLTGKIHISPEGDIARKLAVGRFVADDVILEKLP